MRKLKQIRFYCLILRTRSEFVSCLNKAFTTEESSSESCIAFSCHFALFFSLEQFLSLSFPFIQVTAFVEYLSVWGFIIIRLRLDIFDRNVRNFPNSVKWQIVLFCFITDDYFDNFIKVMTASHHHKDSFFLL